MGSGPVLPAETGVEPGPDDLLGRSRTGGTINNGSVLMFGVDPMSYSAGATVETNRNEPGSRCKPGSDYICLDEEVPQRVQEVRHPAGFSSSLLEGTSSSAGRGSSSEPSLDPGE